MNENLRLDHGKWAQVSVIKFVRKGCPSVKFVRVLVIEVVKGFEIVLVMSY